MYVLTAVIVGLIIFLLGVGFGAVTSGNRNRSLREANKRLDARLFDHDLALRKIEARCRDEVAATGDPLASHIIDLAGEADQKEVP